MKTRLLLAFIIVALLPAAVAHAVDLPPGKWWRRPDIIDRLSLTTDQQNRLEGIFRNSANDLIDLKAEVDKQNVALRAELDQPQLNRQSIQRVAAKLNDARGRLFERELMMLVEMRSVLSESQWNRMRSDLDRMRPPGGPRGMRGDVPPPPRR